MEFVSSILKLLAPYDIIAMNSKGANYQEHRNLSIQDVPVNLCLWHLKYDLIVIYN